MKKRTIILVAIMLIVIGLFAGALYMYNEICPKAPSIQCPEKGEIVSLMIGCNSCDTMFSMGEEHYEELVGYIQKALPTRKQSENDYPTEWPYYCIKIKTGQMQYRYFVYEDGGESYIEMPYLGIYGIEDELIGIVVELCK